MTRSFLASLNLSISDGNSYHQRGATKTCQWAAKSGNTAIELWRYDFRH